jgi:23S rRNA pseudouridine2605 synthase
MEERLQKIISNAGIASRRAAEKMIAEGRVSVNGNNNISFGTKADIEKDEIRLDGKLIIGVEHKIYIMLNKPKGYVTTLHDPENRPIVTDLLTGIHDRVYPVGRLDYDSEGLLILTNDGEFSQKLQHPRYKVPKTYRIKIKGRLSKEELKLLHKGIVLEDGIFKPVDIISDKYNEKSSWLTLSISEGRNRLIRRAFDVLNHPVLRLMRVAIADIQLGSLKEGQYRELTKRELEKLHICLDKKKF